MAATKLFDDDERAGPVTQIFYLSIPVEHQLQDATSGAGRKWAEALDLIAESPGFLRLYWGRQVEESKKVQLHVGRSRRFSFSSFFYLFSIFTSAFGLLLLACAWYLV